MSGYNLSSQPATNPDKEPMVKEMFDAIAHRYDQANHWLSFNRDLAWRRKAVTFVDPKLTIHAVDLCAGTLDFSAALLREHPQSLVTCIDFSEKMLKYGLHKIPTAHKNQIKILCEDATQTTLPDCSQDLVLCGYGMRNIPDQSRALDEIRRMLVKGGQLIILDFFRPISFLPKFFAGSYGKYIMPFLAGLITKNPKAYSYLHNSIESFYTLGAYRSLLTQHGFKITHSRDFASAVTSLIVAVRE